MFFQSRAMTYMVKHFHTISFDRPCSKQCINRSASLILVTAMSQVQFWDPRLLQLTVKNPLFYQRCAIKKKANILSEKGNLQLMTWAVLGKSHV